MLRLITLIVSYLIGKSLTEAPKAHPFLYQIPLLVIRKILKLFLIGFGSLLVGVIGMAFLLKDILFQLQSYNQFTLTSATGVSIFVSLMGFSLCAWILRKNNWVDVADLIVPNEAVVLQEVQHQPDLMTALITFASGFLNEKANRRTSAL